VPHALLRDLLAEVGAIPTFCLPRKGNQKGSVENLVGFVKGDFFFARPFQDRADVAAQLKEWLHATNHLRPCRATHEVPAERFLREKGLLRCLPSHVSPERYTIRECRVVSPSALVLHEGTAYAVDPKAIGHTVDLRVGRDFIEVVDAGKVVARHKRSAKRGIVRSAVDRQATLNVIGGRQVGFFKRECLRELGDGAETFLTRLVHAGKPEAWLEPVAALFDLLQEQGEDRIVAAINTTVLWDDISVHGIRRALGLGAA
jgi:hypothetical protein